MLRKLIIIAGPTATGKTSIAIHLAQLLDGEVISADARQLYRFMDIATAKPTGDETAAAVHHGLDLRLPDEPYSAGEFTRFARAKAAEIWERGKTPIVAGGTGLYIQALLDGLRTEERPSSSARAAIRERLRSKGLASLYAELGRLDPVAQSRVAANDTQRVLRALELVGNSPTGPVEGWDPMPEAAVCFCLHRPRDELDRRIGERIEQMAAQGLVAETEQLVRLGYGRDTPAMQTLGYEEMLDYLEGRCPLESALGRIRLRTRQFAKRQITWFRRDRRYRWLDISRWGREGVAERMVMEYRNRRRF